VRKLDRRTSTVTYIVLHSQCSNITVVLYILFKVNVTSSQMNWEAV